MADLKAIIEEIRRASIGDLQLIEWERRVAEILRPLIPDGEVDEKGRREIARVYLPLDLGRVGRLFQAFADIWPDAAVVAPTDGNLDVAHIWART